MSVLSSLRTAQADWPAFAEWLDHDLTLTPVETRIVRTLGLDQDLGQWTSNVDLVHSVYGDAGVLECDIHSLRVHISRLRRKLTSSPWRIENRYHHGCYRLVRG